MAIKTVSEFNQLLKNYDANKWLKNKASEQKNGDSLVTTSPLAEGKNDGRTFGDFLKDSVGEVNALQVKANEAMEKLATGESKNIHETMLAVEQAELAFKMMNQVRTKVIDAYKEIMKMQV